MDGCSLSDSGVGARCRTNVLERNNPAMTSIKPETINGKLCTVIRRPFDAEWVREQLAMGIPVMGESAQNGRMLIHDIGGDLVMVHLFFKGKFETGSDYVVFSAIEHIISILPPLPRRPTTEHARLLHLYAANGIEIDADYTDSFGEGFNTGSSIVTLNMLGEHLEITGALHNGTPVDVAIDVGDA